MYLHTTRRTNAGATGTANQHHPSVATRAPCNCRSAFQSVVVHRYYAMHTVSVLFYVFIPNRASLFWDAAYILVMHQCKKN